MYQHPGLTVAFVAAALGVPAAEVYRRVAQGKIFVIRGGPRGGRIFISQAELRRLLAQQLAPRTIVVEPGKSPEPERQVST